MKSKMVLRMLSIVLLVCIMTCVMSTAVFARRDPGVVGPTAMNNVSGYGFSGYQQSWDVTYLNAYRHETGQIVDITFNNSIVGQQAADYYRSNQNTSFSQTTTTMLAIMTLVPNPGGLAVKIMQYAVTAAGVTAVFALSDVSFPLAAGDRLTLNDNTVWQLDGAYNKVGSPTRTVTVKITDINGNVKYNRTSIY